MVTIVTRSGKGSPLTNNEMDDNLNNLNSGKTENSAAAITGGTINNTSIGSTTTSTIAGTTGTFSGNVGIGTSSPNALLGVYSASSSVISVNGDATTQIIITRGSTDSSGSSLNFRKSRGTISAPTAVNSFDTIGTSNYTAYDGTSFLTVAHIRGSVDVVSGTDDIGGALHFHTRPVGAGNTNTERFRIGPYGQIGIGGANYGTSGQALVSGGSAAATAWGTLPVAGGGTGVTTAPAAAAVLMGFTTTATAAGTTVLTNASSQFQVFTGATTQTITLPVTSTLGTGWSFHIVNNSTGTLTVNSSGGNLVISIIAGLSAMVTCIGTTLTTAADWEAGLTDFPTATGTGSVVLGTAPTITNAVMSQSNAVRATGTLALAFGTNQFVQVTPNATGTFTTTVPAVGTTCTLIVLTSGTTSYTMTFGTGFKSTGTLATGVTSARYFVFQFVSDGTSLIEAGRTVAIA